MLYTYINYHVGTPKQRQEKAHDEPEYNSFLLNWLWDRVITITSCSTTPEHLKKEHTPPELNSNICFTHLFRRTLYDVGIELHLVIDVYAQQTSTNALIAV